MDIPRFVPHIGLMDIKLAKRYFHHQWQRAKQRDIEWCFTFEEWIAWWEKHLGSDWQRLRGKRKGQYMMGRFGDKGPYSPTNTKCIVHLQKFRTPKRLIDIGGARETPTAA